MSKTACAIASAFALASSASWAAAFEWVNGSVTHITAQLGNYTVVMVSGRGVRFCDPETGSDYAITADNVHFDLLKAALLHSKSVQVAVQNSGRTRRGRRSCASTASF
jgi:ribulose-5-phosphate 4-epimerase/fuculose-1-phosphate aldolase